MFQNSTISSPNRQTRVVADEGVKSDIQFNKSDNIRTVFDTKTAIEYRNTFNAA